MRENCFGLYPEFQPPAGAEQTFVAGQPCELEPLWELGVPVIEDAAHSFESAYRGRKIGGLSDVTCFSLYATKNVTAGEGGLIATNRAARKVDLEPKRTVGRLVDGPA